MSNERDVGGRVASLLLQAREAAGLNLSQLASRAKVSRSRVHAAESATSLPTMEVCLKLARELAVPLGEMVRAHIDDLVNQADPIAVPVVEKELFGSNVHWSAIAAHHGFRIEHGKTQATITRAGDMTVTRRYTGCLATRPRRHIAFRDRIVGERAPLFAVKGAPLSLGYGMKVSVEGEWVQHRVEFDRPWLPEDGGFDFEFETTLPGAYVWDLEAFNRRRRAEGQEQRRDLAGHFRSHVSYPFELLELTAILPDNYEPPWGEPTATWGTAPLDDADYAELHPRTCESFEVQSDRNTASLTLKRPSPGYTFGLQWTPIMLSSEEEGDER